MGLLLELADKSCRVKPITDGMMNLDGEGQKAATIPLKKFSRREDWSEIIKSTFDIEMKALKGDPWNHRNSKMIWRKFWLWVHFLYITIILPILLVILTEPVVIKVKFCPEV